MRSSQIKSTNTLYPSAVNNKIVETKEYNDLQQDVTDLYNTISEPSTDIDNLLVPYTGAEHNVDLNSKTLTTTGKATLTDVDINGNVKFITSGKGMAYGSMYMEDASVATTATTGGSYYPIASGFTTGLTNNVTFQNNKELKILVAGVYKVDWSMSISCDTSDQTIEGLVIAGATGTTAELNTVNAARAKENGVVYSVGGSGLITCVVNDLVRLGLENETSSGKVITCNHANLTIIQIGG
jgi:hypothetical protein